MAYTSETINKEKNDKEDINNTMQDIIQPSNTKQIPNTTKEKDDDDTIEEFENPPQDPVLFLAEQGYKQKEMLHDISRDDEQVQELISSIENIVKEHGMPGWYELQVPEEYLQKDLLEKQKNDLNNKQEEIDDEERQANETAGDSEIFAAQMKRVKCKYISGDNDTEEYFKKIYEKAIGSNIRIDILFQLLHYYLAIDPTSAKVRSTIKKIEGILEDEGDWSRRNRFSVYKSVLAINTKQLDIASNLSVAASLTFASSDFIPLETLALLCVVSSIPTMPRPELKTKIIECSDFIQIYKENPVISNLLFSFYECRFKEFFYSLLDIYNELHNQRLQCSTSAYIVRELRLMAYKQFLRSYHSVHLQSMATTFGVSVQFLDNDLSQFIATNRLQCKIDAVNCTITLHHGDEKSLQYTKLLQNGDTLFAKIQKGAQKLKYI